MCVCYLCRLNDSVRKVFTIIIDGTAMTYTVSCVRSVGEFMFYKVVLLIGVTMIMDMCDNDNVCVTHGPLFAVVTRGYVIHRMNLTTSEVDNGTQRTNEIRHSQPRHMMCGTRTANSHHLHRLARLAGYPLGGNHQCV